MIPRDKILEICSMLMRKTKLNEIQWQEEKPSNYGYRSYSRIDKTGYSISIGGNIFNLDKVSPSADPDYITINIYNSSDRLVGALHAEQGGEDWEIANNLHSEIVRFVLKTDEIVSEMEKLLSKPGRIAASEVHVSSTSDNGEIPF